MEQQTMKIQDLTLIALMAALTCILGPMSITLPFTPVPISFTNLVIYFAVMVIGMKRGTISYLVYLLIGAVGLPVFSGFSGGLAKLAGPTGGYIVGFLLTALIIGLIMKLAKGKSEITKIVITVVSMILGDIGCFAIGTVWFMVVMKMNLSASLTLCVVPYIVPDLAKIIVATIIVNRLKKYVKIFN